MFEFAGEWGDGVERLAVAFLVVEGEVYVEHVLPLLPDDGQRLYLRQVEFVEGEHRQDGAEAAFLVGQGEDEACLVDVPCASHGGRFLRMGEDEEAREVMLVRLDAFLQDLHAVDVGGVAVADGGVSVPPFAADVSCGACGVSNFYNLEVRMQREKFAALHESDRMGVDLRQVFPTLPWQTHDAVADAELVFAHDGHAALAQQFVVVEQASCDGVLYCHESQHVWACLEPCKHLLEGVAADQFHLLALEEAMSGNVVETALDALYCYPSNHLSLKNPASLLSGICMYVLLYYTLFIYIRRSASLHLLK